MPSEPANKARAPDFTLRDISGRRVRLSDYLGTHVILIAFWATWCGPCVAEMPHLQRLYVTHSRERFVVLGVSMDGPESIAEVAPRARRYGVTFPVLLDEETRVVGLYNPRRDAPYSILVDKSGAVVGSRVGYSPGDEQKLEADVQALLRARP
ncbi:MAG TPA: TlpA disulfide reductase family protein [Polyangiaceae bacterium]|nr:TlpA disulfide reductase family protein [Polyangiaceae bacterium]